MICSAVIITLVKVIILIPEIMVLAEHIQIWEISQIFLICSLETIHLDLADLVVFQTAKIILEKVVKIETDMKQV